MDRLQALATLSFDWADTPDHVWRDSPYHVDGLHADALAAIDTGIRDASITDGPSPIGLVLQGLKGVGKTHLLGLVRRQVHRARGYFFLDDVTAAEAFWENTAEALRRGLARTDDSGESQLRRFLLRVCLRSHVDPEVEARIRRGRGLTPEDLEAFVDGVASLDEVVADECGDTARALVLIASRDPGAKYVGDDYLDGDTELTSEARKWNIYSRPKPSRVLVQEITRLLALTGPVVIAVDQLDTLVARSVKRTQEIGDSAEEDLLVAQIADGLMGLREVTRKTLTVLACLPSTWQQIKTKAAGTVPDRFRETVALGRITDAGVGRALVEKRLGVAYETMDFTPPHPTWPVAPVAFDEPWDEWTPRQLLKRIGAHIELCLRAGQVKELTSFDEKAPVPAAPVRTEAEHDRFAELDAEFEKLRAEADPKTLLAEKTVDRAMPDLLSAALRCWVTEVGDDELEWSCERQNGRSEVHAWLSRTLDEAADLQEHWAFRAIAARDPRAALSRFRKARSAAGQLHGAENRHLVILRDAWGRGAKTREEVAKFTAAGGRTIRLADGDVRTFWALQKLLGNGGRELHEWLIDRRPASRSGLLSAVLPEKPAGVGAEKAAERQPAGATHPPPADGEITLGTVVGSGEPVRIELSALRKHAAVFAGSGSGKTVLLRRIVEECALQGVSAIVLDPNNDLARLGDAWPEPPGGWTNGDAELAKQYLAETDVVVWTPGRATGQPLAFRPLPDFAGVLDDTDEFTAAVEVAVATLAPQVRLTGSTAKANIGLAVLRQAVVHHARTGSRSLPDLIELMSDLPEGVSNLNDAKRIAADLAEVLKAAMVNDPLFAGGGEPVDPGVLLAPGDGKRARVSVISFVGLPAEEQRQNFVNQLQMELFAWIKRHPAGDRPLGALFVMDEAQTLASSGSLTASTRSTIVLASQARKYGLGLLFATQAPKGLHNQVVGNAMTQFFGRLNSPAQIAAANELARAKGSPVADISRLERAQFYVAGEAFGFRQVATPLCLSHHPASPLRLEEVIARARLD
ncbi:ATP-binding protein [Amycolatopsis rifamycinica]|uniref:ATPase AAA n=1 Tax=Amycolatopsis rifamycinica TaxID=287986 RepID=A0A066TZG7_9PSEU|nr:ATP-binding protein [Amycolatopsis rifamycinica]KDN17388.1 ATPase AAA [Amycolatopsis rifamycinica]